MQKYVKKEKRYRLTNFICPLAVYKKLIGTGRVLCTRILRYASVRLIICDTALKFSAIFHYHLMSLFLLLEIKKRIQNAINFDFLSFTFKPEVRSSHEMFIVTKWTNRDLLCLVYHFQIK